MSETTVLLEEKSWQGGFPQEQPSRIRDAALRCFAIMMFFSRS